MLGNLLFVEFFCSNSDLQFLLHKPNCAPAFANVTKCLIEICGTLIGQGSDKAELVLGDVDAAKVCFFDGWIGKRWRLLQIIE